MIDRLSGKVLHIDFGDCFEVAMTREKFPEKIPFRLTRMLIKAMEISNIEGTYRITCEQVLKVLRHDKDSLIAVLEAFVYDPLLVWGLTWNSAKNYSPAQNDLINTMVNTATANLEAMTLESTNRLQPTTDDLLHTNAAVTTTTNDNIVQLNNESKYIYQERLNKRVPKSLNFSFKFIF
jgi:FKBP12-rapamycin complex-associated protein